MFRAQYAGRCPLCRLSIVLGDRLEWQAGRPVHEGCYFTSTAELSPVELQPGEVVCDRCWLVKPCGCED